MSVSPGQAVSAAVVNNAYISKISDSTAVSKITLNRPGSGAQVDDIQKRLNESIYNTYATEEIAASGEITTDLELRFQYRRVKGLAGNQTASATPFGTGGGWNDGMIIRLIGVDDANTVTLENNDSPKGAILNGNIELKKYQSLTLQYDATLDRWIEQGRN